MNWLNIELKTLRSAEYLGSTPEQRATWVNLLAFCADHENGGTFECHDWGDRKWMQLVGVTLSEVKSECDLWSWNKSGIVVVFYPTAQEKKVKRNRKNGRKGGRPSADKPSGKPCGSNSLKRNSNSKGNSKGNSNEKKEDSDAKKNLVAVQKHYNSVRGEMSECMKLTPIRERQIAARIKDVGLERLMEIITECSRYDLFQGRNDRGWKPDLEWITKESNFIKILEGKYRATKPTERGARL